MSLTHHITIARRFQKSIRIDTDIHDVGALEGFICPRSSADVLIGMAKQLGDTGHGAYTWTGPYGSGKSSLVVALCAALSGQMKTRDAASRVLGEDTFRSLTTVMPAKSQGWHCIAIVGRRAPLAEIVGQALEVSGLARKPKAWDDASALQALKSLLARDAKTHGGVVLIIDEMGKALEGAAHDGHDIYLLQQLAELSARADKRFVIVGILHQAFDEYAQKLTREARDEWAKIQGRFVDLVINSSSDEQLELLSRALETSGKPQAAHTGIEVVARLTGTTGVLVRTKEACSPSSIRQNLRAFTISWPMRSQAISITQKDFGTTCVSISSPLFWLLLTAIAGRLGWMPWSDRQLAGPPL
jgi:hypothetical protein